MLIDFEALMNSFVRDESGRIGVLDQSAALAAALARYDRDRPRFDGAGRPLPHVVSDTEDTVPAGHREALAAYAASLLLEQLATAAINDGDVTIQADATARRSKAEEYRASARAYMVRYTTAIQGPVAGGAAGTVTSWGRRPRFPRRRFV